MSEDILLRQWTETDWQIFRAIRLEALAAHPDVFAPLQNEAEQDESFWKERLQPKNAVFGLYDGEDVIGLTGVFRHKDSPDKGIVVMNYIRPEYRGRSVSGLFYQACIDWAQRQGDIRTLLVGFREGVEATRLVSEKWGFTFLSTEQETFGDGETVKHYTYQLTI